MDLYFDNAATTALDPEVLEAMVPYLLRHYGNPSSGHRQGLQARQAVEQARRTVAELLGASPGEIVFTAGATESNNLALTGTLPAFRLQHVITSPLEHKAVLEPLSHLMRTGRVRLHFVQLGASGAVNERHLETLLDRYPGALVSLMHGNNEVGNLLDLPRVAHLVRERGGRFHSDTVQTVGRFRYDLRTLPVDFLVGSAHKFHGPKGVGFLYARDPGALSPLLRGGGQERGLRGGTENVAGIVGLARALEIAHRDLDEHVGRIQAVKTALAEGLERLNLPGLVFNGQSPRHGLPTVLSVRFPALLTGEPLLDRLHHEGVAVSGGSACSAGLGSHVLQALGVAAAGETVRFSLGKHNTPAQVGAVLELLESLYHPRRGASATPLNAAKSALNGLVKLGLPASP